MGLPDLELREDGTLVVEAPSAEAALAAVQQHCGPDANIVEAGTVQTKGLGGFFSKQLYRVHVAPTGREYESTNPITPPAAEETSLTAADMTSSAVEEAVDIVLRRVEAGENDDGRTFGETLHAELSAGVQQGGVTQSPAFEDVIRQREAMLRETIDLRDSAPFVSTPAPSQPDVDPRTASDVVAQPMPFVPSFSALPARVPLGRPLDEWIEGAGPVQWSVDHLSRLGLPYRLIHQLADLDPADDLAWVFRLAESAAPLCGPMPETAMVMLGRDLHDAATRFGVDHSCHPDPPAYEGDVAVSLDNIETAASYLDRVLAGRPVHLLCDDSGFGAELLGPVRCPGELSVVSTTKSALAIALQVVVACDGVLGYLVEGEQFTRVTPFELALAVRSQLPRS